MMHRNPLAKVRGLGSAKNGTGHWWNQRLTAIVLLLTTPWLVWVLLGLVGADYVTVRATIAEPWNAVALVLLLGALFWHAQLGMQVVIEDYVHTTWLEIALQVIVKLACLIAAIAAVVAVGRIAFGA